MADLTEKGPQLLIAEYGEDNVILIYTLDKWIFAESSIPRRIQTDGRRGATIPAAVTTDGRIVVCCYRHLIVCSGTDRRKTLVETRMPIAFFPDDCCISGDDLFILDGISIHRCYIENFSILF